MSKKEHNASLKDIDSKVSKEIVSVAEKSQSNFELLESRLSSEIGKISSRIDSLERLNNDLEQALKKMLAGKLSCFCLFHFCVFHRTSLHSRGWSFQRVRRP